jgi:hypothetical protein
MLTLVASVFIMRWLLKLGTEKTVGRDSSVSIVTRYGLEDREIVSRTGEIFRTCSDPP